MNQSLHFFYKIVLGGIFLLGICTALFAQIEHGGIPYSFKKKSSDSFMRIVLPAMDNQLLLQKEIKAEGKEGGYQFGEEIAVDYRLDNSGSWDELPDGGRLWRLGIESKGAYSINLLFDRFYIPPASHLFIYTADQSFVLGSFTAENNNRWGNFATTLLPGDAIVLEFYEAAPDRNNAIIQLSTVVHGYKNFFPKKEKKGTYGNSGSCNVNINCGIGQPYRAVKQAVALILNRNSRYCSGTLVNNTAQDTTPYFLTAHHCLAGGDPSHFVFIFNYETSDCGGNDPVKTYSINGATAVAIGCDTSDFALLLLNDRPTADFNPYYAGWNRKDILYTDVVAIHHPRGDWKKISRDKNTIKSGKFYQDNTNPLYPYYPDNTHYIVVWDTGTTEECSSGSGLFNQEQLLIGQLYGGYASCYSRKGEDYYGKLAYSWTNNNHSGHNRLDYWLDPLKLGVESLKGFDPYGTLSVQEVVKQENMISIYPNPTRGTLKIESGKGKMESIAVYDMLGRKIVETTAIQDNVFVLTIEELHTGLYLLKIKTENSAFVKKFFKQ